MLTIYHLNDNIIELTGLKDSTTGNVLSTATVTFDLQELDGTSVSSGTMTADSAELGTYRGNIPDSISLSSELYNLFIYANAGAGLQATWKLLVAATDRV